MAILNKLPSIEQDVAQLTHVSTSKDGTTKLLLKLMDGLKVETSSLSSTMLEITLLSGVSDSHEDAMDLIGLCKPIEETASKLVVNLIPWKNIWAPSGAAASLFEQPSPEQVLQPFKSS
jgi:adenine C2-methylase RlmN of 23S rRNA A2503 and tRNA A37